MKEPKLIDRVREAAQGMGGAFGMEDLADRLGIQAFADKEKLRRRQVAALVKSGELVRVKPGQFNWRGRPKTKPSAEKRMWFVLRKRGTVNPSYLAQMADTSPEYALSFLKRLSPKYVREKEKSGVGPGEFSLVNDPGPEMPPNLANADKCRRWREQKKAVIASLDAVYTGALDVMQKAAAARLAVSELEES